MRDRQRETEWGREKEYEVEVEGIGGESIWEELEQRETWTKYMRKSNLKVILKE